LYDPKAYDAWYTQGHGKWIGDVEYSLIMKLLEPSIGESLLDVGCGTGHFSRRFEKLGLQMTGLDLDNGMLDFARTQNQKVTYLRGSATKLPFKDLSFDYSTAITSLCFVDIPVYALNEMWRVSRQGIVVGLLNHNSLLYRKKFGKGSYAGARWDRWTDVKKWILSLTPAPVVIKHRTAIFIPDDSIVARIVEKTLPHTLPWGGFLVVYLSKN